MSSLSIAINKWCRKYSNRCPTVAFVHILYMQLLCQTDTYEWLQRTGSDMTQANITKYFCHKCVHHVLVFPACRSVPSRSGLLIEFVTPYTKHKCMINADFNSEPQVLLRNGYSVYYSHSMAPYYSIFCSARSFAYKKMYRNYCKDWICHLIM